MKTVAYIPIRSGSKSIPDKNIKQLAGKPLACWVIQAALDCKEIDEVFIGTDSSLYILEITRVIKSSKLHFYIRNKSNCTDEASTEDAIEEFANKFEWDLMVLLQATSPLTSSKDISDAIYKYKQNKENNDSLLSVVPCDRFIWTDGKSINYNHMNRPRRQDFITNSYFENGAIYITPRKTWNTYKNRLGIAPIPFVMDRSTEIEIDEPSYFKKVEKIFYE